MAQRELLTIEEGEYLTPEQIISSAVTNGGTWLLEGKRGLAAL